MSRKSKKYIPALKFHWLTRFYDPLLKLIRGDKLIEQLAMQANPLPKQLVLDLACGTGTLAVMLKEKLPKATVTGIDADSQVLAIAERKAMKKKLDVSFQQSLSSDLPFRENQFDKVLSSLFFHHLTLDMKHKTLEEVFRVLIRGGDFYILDFDRPQNRWMRLAFLPIQIMDGFETTRDHVKGVISELLHEEGFVEVKEIEKFNTVVGTLRLYSARKPE